MTVSGGYGANVSSSTVGNGYYTLAIKPINIGGPFALSFAVTSIYGTYNTIQSNLTVTAPLVVPVANVLAGTVIAGQTGTIAHIGGAHTLSLSWWTGGGSTVYLLPPAGYYDGGTWTYYTDPNLVPGNIASGVSILGVTGTFSGAIPTHGSQVWTTPGTYTWTVPAGVTSITAILSGGGGGAGGGDYVGYYNGSIAKGGGGGGGGGGGTYIGAAPVTPGQVYIVVVGAGGAGGSRGNYYYPWSGQATEIPAGNGASGGSSSVAGVIGYGGGYGAAAWKSGSNFYPGSGGSGGGNGGGYGQGGGSGTVGGSDGSGQYHVDGGNPGASSNGVSNQGGTGGAYGAGTAGGNGRVVIQW